jgi:hypothetical protein
MILQGSIGIAAFALIWMSACSAPAAQTDSQACTWPAILDPADVSTGQCVAARALLSCQGSNGSGEGCLSNDPMQCPSQNHTPGVTYSACQDQCNADEYAVACGGPGPASSVSPPDGCRQLLATPGGVVYVCCPCG